MSRAGALSQIDAALTRIGRSARSRRASAERRARSGVELPDTAVLALAAVYRHGPLRLRAVAGYMDLEPSRASKEIRRLVAAGLVKQAQDPHDSRAHALTVTARGRRAFERYRQAADDILAEALAGWGDEQLREAAVLLERLAASFDGEPRTSARPHRALTAGSQAPTPR